MTANWIKNKYFDSLFILFPHYLGLLLLLFFSNTFNKYNKEIPTSYWFILIVCIDVAHVYATLFRTYFDKEALLKNANTLLLIPFICLIFGMLLHSFNSLYFWRILAYIAVFHFIKQQYGFLKIYLKDTQQPKWMSQVDIFTIYSLTLLPILIWHFSGNKNFNWFVENDFLMIKNIFLKKTFIIINILLFIFFLLKEIYIFSKTSFFNLPKFLLILGTGLSWFIGIVLLNGDLAFTTLNVVAHGIPYMALIWVSGKNNNLQKTNKNSFLNIIFSVKGLFLFLAIIFVFAFIEEGLWDNLIWSEHPQLFSFLKFLPNLSNHYLAHILVPLLTLPQITHYILDGFIWRNKNKSTIWT